MKLQKYYIIFVYILEGKMGKMEKNLKKIRQLKWAKYQKPKDETWNEKNINLHLKCFTQG